MNTITNRGLIIFGLILGVSLVTVGATGAHVFYTSKTLDQTINVTGSSEQLITSDIAKWRSSFSRSAGVDNLKDAYAGLKNDLQQVAAYFKQNGIPDSAITINPIAVFPVYQQGSYGPGGSIVGYTLTQTATVESANTELIAKSAQNSGILLNQGVVFTSEPIEYYYSKLADLKLQMLAEATKNAKERAVKIAESSGSKVAKLQSAAVGVFQITPPNSTDISDYGFYDTSSKEKKVTAVVRASFFLK